jgi:hypothetical protein
MHRAALPAGSAATASMPAACQLGIELKITILGGCPMSLSLARKWAMFPKCFIQTVSLVAALGSQLRTL